MTPNSPNVESTRDMAVPPSLAGAEWLARPQTQRVLRVLTDAGREARIVGGTVRNALIGKPVSDVDIATTALPEEVMTAARAAGLHAVPTGLQHGTVTVIADHVPHEVTTLRQDVDTDGRRATVLFTRDWAADAARRDFTMNALYCDADGRVYDPLGGYPDLAARRVRFIGSADARIAEDYLRILRFFRFYAEYAVGMPDPEGVAACIRGRHGIARLSAERIRAEMIKLIVAAGAEKAIRAMFESGLLVAVIGAVPRLGALCRIIAIEMANQAGASAMRRLGALMLHAEGDSRRRACHLRLSNAEEHILAAAVSPLARRLGSHLADRDMRRILHGIGKAQWRDAVMMRWAWAGADPGDPRWKHVLTLPQRSPIPDFPVKGADLLALGLMPGPSVGEILRQLEAEWSEQDFAPGRDDLLARARGMIEGLGAD